MKNKSFTALLSLFIGLGACYVLGDKLEVGKAGQRRGIFAAQSILSSAVLGNESVASKQYGRP
jgi:hypothetical protein